MKRILAILALFGVVLVLPLSAVASPADGECQSGAVSQGVVIPPSGGDDGDAQDQQENQGDPDELGGGFRNHGRPPGSDCTGPEEIIWIDTLIIMVMQMF
ncbi:MAG TPA: hypothetical protein PLL30_05520 [Candidatus Krumholzibacteria bacterium]|nr:hypothetical protein [Candidatus Krumholzibacteria bacterium]HPD71221.1 hypothetical protein [Candidatus Krumholzibacteria bacterium]HRY39079.1 hypothetical protein [Candidatus Krumholzibacteria bacterium]